MSHREFKKALFEDGELWGLEQQVLIAMTEKKAVSCHSCFVSSIPIFTGLPPEHGHRLLIVNGAHEPRVVPTLDAVPGHVSRRASQQFTGNVLDGRRANKKLILATCHMCFSDFFAVLI